MNKKMTQEAKCYDRIESNTRVNASVVVSLQRCLTFDYVAHRIPKSPQPPIQHSRVHHRRRYLIRVIQFHHLLIER